MIAILHKLITAIEVTSGFVYEKPWETKLGRVAAFNCNMLSELRKEVFRSSIGVNISLRNDEFELYRPMIVEGAKLIVEGSINRIKPDSNIWSIQADKIYSAEGLTDKSETPQPKKKTFTPTDEQKMLEREI
jgi:hypothetical protein